MIRYAALLFPCFLAACGPDMAHHAAEESAHGAALYAEHCAACHGSDAQGGGTASLGLGAAPPALSTLAQDNGGVFPYDRVMATIDGEARGDDPDSPMPLFGRDDPHNLSIPAHGSLDHPVPEDLQALAAYIASIQTR